jgi:uroporphyrinogen decarboxylase
MTEARRGTKKEKYIVFWTGSIFHTYTYIRGIDNALIDIAEENNGFFSLLEILLDYQLKRLDLLQNFRPDGVLIADDWGTQQAMMINPEQWRRIFKPMYRKIAGRIHEIDALAHFHTCGYTLPILEDLIECGFDEINPQVQLMDREKVAQIFKDRCCIRPDLDRQGLLVQGNPSEVSEHVRNTFNDLKTSRGGYLGHIPVEMNVPIENAEAMMKIYRELAFERSDP